jgi:hypothetical protein
MAIEVQHMPSILGPSNFKSAGDYKSGGGTTNSYNNISKTGLGITNSYVNKANDYIKNYLDIINQSSLNFLNFQNDALMEQAEENAKDLQQQQQELMGLQTISFLKRGVTMEGTTQTFLNEQQEKMDLDITNIYKQAKNTIKENTIKTNNYLNLLQGSVEQQNLFMGLNSNLQNSYSNLFANLNQLML